MSYVTSKYKIKSITILGNSVAVKIYFKMLHQYIACLAQF